MEQGGAGTYQTGRDAILARLSAHRALPAPPVHLLLPPPPPQVTREAYLHAIRGVILPRVQDEKAREALAHARMAYGAGCGSARGVTYYGAWRNGQPAPVEFVEVCATCESSLVQVRGTTIHECAHVVAGHTAGHGAEWKKACALLGLTRAEAQAQQYKAEDFAPEVWRALEALPSPTDGNPEFGIVGAFGVGLPFLPTGGGCTAGYGTRGGKSRGAGSGSRNVLAVCACDPPRKIRASASTLDGPPITCGACNAPFARSNAEGSAP